MTDQQMTLARAPRSGSSYLNKTARQVVPQFLQKIYEMVNDPANSELIRWSDTGDSFYVLDHERFAREVLGRWFKHQNFASFVRQLNMYGFHKIPHLQQGVLKSENEAEFWNFEHPNFHRGKPDLLCLIQRKKQAGQGDEPQVELNNAARVGSPVGNLSAGQILDINSIVSGIAAIKRHQTAISTDLNDLKTSNQHLWQEAMAGRERHKKHQDTINRILKFLAGVFGHQAARKDDGSHSPSRVVVPRVQQRLLIEGGGDGKSKGTNIAEVGDEESNFRSPYDRGTSPVSTNRFISVEVPQPITPASTAIPSKSFSSTISEPTPSVASTSSMPRSNISHNEPLDPYSNANLSVNDQVNHPYQPQQTQNTPAPYTSQQLTTTTSRPQSPDAVMQNAFAQMLQSPTQMQRLLAALASQSINPMHDQPSPQPEIQSSQQLQHYDPPIDYSRAYNIDQADPGFDPSLLSSLPVVSPPLNQSEGVISFDQIAENDNRLQKTYTDVAEIDQDVNALHTSLNSLIESLGLDPQVLASSPDQDAQSQQQQSSINPHDTLMSTGLDEAQEDQSGQDFDFDAFLTDFTREGDGNTDYTHFADKLDPSARSDQINEPSPEQLTAFLDEVASPSDGAVSPISFRHDSPDIQAKRGGKRKSDVAGISIEDQSTGKRAVNHGTKLKRKK